MQLSITNCSKYIQGRNEPQTIRLVRFNSVGAHVPSGPDTDRIKDVVYDLV